MHLCHHFSGVLGHIIDSTGLHPSPAKVQAIQKAPPPTNIAELKAFVGLVNYYHKFLPNLSSTLSPLHILLRKWNWTQNQQIAFDKVKELLQSDALLVHFDSKKPILVYADASPYGVGPVVAHKMPDNPEKPIALVHSFSSLSGYTSFHYRTPDGKEVTDNIGFECILMYLVK